MDSEFIDSYITLDAHLPIDHSPSGPPSNSMSPVPSAASTPPTTTSVPNLMASSFAPVPLSSQPAVGGYPLGVSGYPRRAEHSYLHHHHNHHHQHLQPQPHHSQPYSFGAPPPPPFPKVAVRAPQLPTGPVSAAAIHMQQQQTPSNGSASASDNLNINDPDPAAPQGTGGSRKRPKYTRSKKGCLTCRSKKIKCDERKPMCTRCEHGHRECTWPEAVLPRRPKGAVRGVGDENDGQEEDAIDAQRRPSIPGSAVSTQFPSSATSTHFNGGIPTNSPFEPAPPRPGAGRDVFESDVYPAAGSQFSMPIIPANARSLYPRAPGSADFYPVTTVNGQPIDDYEFPPRQQQQQQQQQPQGPYGSASGSGGGSRGGYSNSSLYAAGPPGAVPGASSYNGDLRRASWDSSAPTDGRRPSWDANSMGAHASSVSSPASSTLGLGLGGILPPRGAGGSSSSNSNNASGATAGPNNNGNNGLMLFQSPDPLSPFFRSVQERNLVGFDPLSNNPFSFNNNSYSSSSSSPFSSSPASSSSASSHYTTTTITTATPTTTLVVSPASYDASTIPAVAQHSFDASSPVLSNASSSDFGITADGVAYRKNSYPHLLFSSSSMSESSTTLSSSQPLTIDPPAPIAPQGVDLRRPSVDLLSLAEKTGGNKPDEEVEWLAPPSMDIVTRPFSSFEEESFASWSAYS